MRLISFTVEKFRSILAARQISLGATTVLIGPNNEGKSNILRALAVGMNALTQRNRSSIYGPIRSSLMRRRLRLQQSYNWDLDFPLTLQAKRPDDGSLITLEFELSEQETVDFRDAVGSKLSGRLPISLFFRKDGAVEPLVLKQGPGQKILTKKAARIAEFLSSRIDIQYIPAVRTSEAAVAVVDTLVEKELALLESNPRYVQALADIESIQQPALRELSQNIEATMKTFVRGLAKVDIRIEQTDRSVALRRASSIIIDDGVATSLEQKGEGIQSLAALAIMRHASETSNRKKDVVIALEEPESHLHPDAIHQLKIVIGDLALRNQVVLTTHNPLFANRIEPSGNIIVHKNKAYAASSLAEVRTVLGVRLADNLRSAEVVLIVEGEEDKIALTSIIRDESQELNNALRAGALVIDVLGGAGNLAHRVRVHKEAFCFVHVFLDNDKAGKQAFARAESEGLLGIEDINFASWGSDGETELEDCYVDEVWADIAEGIGLVATKHPSCVGKKWGDRARFSLKSAGKPHDDTYIQFLKMQIAARVAVKGWIAIHESKRGPIGSLMKGLLAKLAYRGS